jgi:hypothetical protein
MQKAKMTISKIEDKYPELLADKCADKYPVVYKIDTINFTDFINSVDSFYDFKLDTIHTNDTIYKTKLKESKSFIKEIIYKHTPTIIKIVSDSAKVFSYQVKLDTLIKEKEKYKNLYDVWFKIAIALFIMLLISIAIRLYGSK